VKKLCSVLLAGFDKLLPFSGQFRFLLASFQIVPSLKAPSRNLDLECNTLLNAISKQTGVRGRTTAVCNFWWLDKRTNGQLKNGLAGKSTIWC